MDQLRLGLSAVGDQTSTVEGSERFHSEHDRRLHKFPLAFVDHKTEMTYTTLSMQSFHFRGKTAAVLLALVTILMWVVFLPLLHTKTLPSACYSSLWLLDLGHAVALGCCICLYFLSSSSLSPPWLELTVLLVPLPLVMLWTGWILGEISHTEWESTMLITVDYETVKAMTYEFKLYSDYILLVLLFIAVVVYDQIFQCRTSRSLYCHIFLALLYGAVRVSEAITLGGHFASTVLIVIRIVEFSQCLFVATVLTVTFVGRYNKEALDRETFLSIEEDRNRLKRLRVEQCRRIGVRGETVTESLIHRIRKTRLDVQHAAFEAHHHGDTKLLQGDEILRQCVEILLNCEQLTAMPGKRRDLDSPENLELEYLRMMAGNTQDSSPSKEASNVENTINRPMGCDLTIPEVPQDDYYVGQREVKVKASPHLLATVGEDPHLDLRKVADEYPNVLVEVGSILLRPRLANLRVPERVVLNYLRQVENKYWANPYHSASHGAMVAHMWQCIITSLGLFECITPLQQVASLIAALAHDVGHPGRNNAFYVNWGSMVAFLYNDHAILERYHCMLAFRLAQMGTEVNIFQNLTRREYVQIRSLMIEFILATDMSQHFSSISKFRLRREAGNFKPYEDPEDIKLMIRMCGKLADLSHAFADWPQHLEWSFRVAEEFYQQGSEEAELGLPISPLCDRNEHSDWAKSQSGFLQFVVLPLVLEMNEVNSESSFEVFVESLLKNKCVWDDAAEAQEEFPIPQSIQTLEVPPAALPDIYTLMLVRARTVEQSNADPMKMNVRPQDPTPHRRDDGKSPAATPSRMPPQPPSPIPPMKHTQSLSPAPDPVMPLTLPDVDPFKPATAQALQPSDTLTPPLFMGEPCLRIAIQEPSSPAPFTPSQPKDADVTAWPGRDL